MSNVDSETTKQQKTNKKNSFWREFLEISLRLLCFLVIVFCLFRYMFGIAHVNGNNMYPAMRDGDLIFFNRLVSEYKQGDVVVFEKDGKIQCARVVAVGGDQVDMTEDGELKVNGSVQEEEGIYYPTEPRATVDYPVYLADSQLFVLGDLRASAADSRDYGGFSKEDVLGKAVTILRSRNL